MTITKWEEETGFTRMEDVDDVGVTLTMEEYRGLRSCIEDVHGTKEYYRGKAEAYGRILNVITDTLVSSPVKRGHTDEE